MNSFDREELKSQDVTANQTNNLVPGGYGRELALSSGSFSLAQLNQLQHSWSKKHSIVDTPTIACVRKMLEQDKSVIIKMPHRSGKTSVCQQIEDDIFIEGNFWDEGSDDPRWSMISNASDGDQLIKEIWEIEGFPLPSMTEFRSYGRLKGGFSKEKAGLTCFVCDHECVLYPKTQTPFPQIFRSDELLDPLSKIDGPCKLLRTQVERNLATLPVNLLIEIPRKLDSDFIAILKELRSNRELILLCPPESLDLVTSIFPNFRIKNPPRMETEHILKIYGQRLRDAGMPVSPLSTGGLKLILKTSRNNIGEFMDKAFEIIEELDANTLETVPAAFVATRLIESCVSPEEAVKLVVGEMTGWISPSRIADVITNQFGLQIAPKKVGQLIREMLNITGLRDPRMKREAAGMSYFVNNSGSSLLSLEGTGDDDVC